MKLELGAGPNRQTPGYKHADINAFDDIDYVGNAWDLALPSASCEEIIAVSFMEHLTYVQFDLVLRNVKRMLSDGGVFLFDVPDLEAWCRYFVSPDAPFDQAYALKTLYGWQRWDGDEHNSGWTEPLLKEYLANAGFTTVEIVNTAEQFMKRGIYRYRFARPHIDSHLYVTAQ